MARPVVGAHFRREEEDARASRTFSTAVATKDKDSTLPADMQGLPGGGLTSGATILLASGVIMNQEMYVVNDETMLAAGWLGLMYLFVKGGASGVAEALDERAAAIEADLAAQRQEEGEAGDLMISKAQDSIAVNEELIKVCAPENFDEWTTFKMEKTLARARNESAAQTLKKLGEVQRIEETAQRRKMASIIAEVNSNVAAAIASNANFASESIDEAIGAISKAKTAA